MKFHAAGKWNINVFKSFQSEGQGLIYSPSAVIVKFLIDICKIIAEICFQIIPLC